MNMQLVKNIMNYAEAVLKLLDADAKELHVARPPLVELFIDTLQALEQNKEQED